MGFLTGHELTWMPEALRILRDELPNVDVVISSQYSPRLADRAHERKGLMWRFFDAKEARRIWGNETSRQGAVGCGFAQRSPSRGAQSNQRERD